MTGPTTVADEVKAIARIVTILDKLDPHAQDRAFLAVADRYPVDDSQEGAN